MPKSKSRAQRLDRDGRIRTHRQESGLLLTLLHDAERKGGLARQTG